MTEQSIKCRQGVIAILKQHLVEGRRNPTKASLPHLNWLEKNIARQEKKLLGNTITFYLVKQQEK